MPDNLKEILHELAKSDIPLKESSLAELSNLKADELSLLEKQWSTIENVRKNNIIGELVELAENNFEMNFDSVFKLALKDNDAEVRSKAIEGLWEDEEPSLINILSTLLEVDESEKVRASAATGLGKFAMLAELKKLRPAYANRVVEVLLKVLANKKTPPEVKRRVLEAASPLSIPQVSEAIKQAYNGDDIKLRVSAIYAMGKNCDSSWLPILIREMSNSNPEIRYEAVTACGELCDRDAVPQLIKLIDDKDLEIQLAAIQALGKIGGAQAKRCLRRCTQSPEDAICQAAEAALEELEVEDSFLV